MSEGRDAMPSEDYQGGARPGYRSVLPRVFPYKRWLSLEEAFNCVGVLSLETNSGDGVGKDMSFSVTTHRFSVEGNVTLWLSSDAAESLVGSGVLSHVESTEIGNRR